MGENVLPVLASANPKSPTDHNQPHLGAPDLQQPYFSENYARSRGDQGEDKGSCRPPHLSARIDLAEVIFTYDRG